jgi:hypothetical protein
VKRWRETFADALATLNRLKRSLRQRRFTARERQSYKWEEQVKSQNAKVKRQK